jgi:hypothetical protein
MSDSTGRNHYLVGLGHDPIEMDTDQIYAIGRSRECAIVINDVLSGRRHCELRYDTYSFKLCDLGSRNGTFVNDRRIKEKTLANNDIIRIGAQVFQYIMGVGEVDLETDEIGENFDTATEMAKMMQLQSDGGILGSLAQFSLMDLLQFLHFSRRTGVLEVVAEGSNANLWMSEGQILDAECCGQTGHEGLTALVRGASGFFRFRPAEASFHKKLIETPTQNLLLELCRVIDEDQK